MGWCISVRAMVNCTSSRPVDVEKLPARLYGPLYPPEALCNPRPRWPVGESLLALLITWRMEHYMPSMLMDAANLLASRCGPFRTREAAFTPRQQYQMERFLSVPLTPRSTPSMP